ncbi:MAG: DNA methyltransferase [bacterium]
MQTQTLSKYYPISLNKIKTKVVRKNNFRNNKTFNNKQKNLFNEDLNNHVKEIVNDYGEKITRVDGEIPINLSIKDNDTFLFISYDQSILTHGLHKYPAKFFPELPRWLIKKYSNEYDIILDPFTGSGTTNLEALLNKRHSVGIDIDPFSRYLAKVKTTKLSVSKLEQAKNIIINSILNYKPNTVSDTDIPDFPYRDNWFNKEIILELAYIKKQIKLLKFEKSIKDFFLICFSSIIREVSNADNNCTRTVIRKKLNKKVYPSDALTKFTERILLNIPKFKNFVNQYPSNLDIEFPTDSDAKNINYRDNYFDLAITSPPYANAVDYPRTHQLEIYWLGFENGSLTPLKRKHVGTESVLHKDYKDLHKSGIPDADSVITKIFDKDKRRAFIVYKYLMDMQKNIQEVYRVLKKDSHYIIVIGNNRIRGELFENWKYIKHIAENNGFKLECLFGSEIIKHFIKVPRKERINTDWILVLKK